MIKYRGIEGIPIIRAEEAKTMNTGAWRIFKPLRNEKCIKCRICWQMCPENAVKLDGRGLPYFDYGICKGCGICARNCPVKAIEMVRDTHAEDMPELQKQ